MAKRRKHKPDENKSADRHIQPRLAFHLSQALLDAFDAYIASLEPRPAESTVLRLALEKYLTEKGFWPPSLGGGKK
jgi:hypothetical protein